MCRKGGQGPAELLRTAEQICVVNLVSAAASAVGRPKAGHKFREACFPPRCYRCWYSYSCIFRLDPHLQRVATANEVIFRQAPVSDSRGTSLSATVRVCNQPLVRVQKQALPY
jgi:hypothetical protein